MKLESVIGQEKLKQQLLHSAQTDRVSQAMLFVGGIGVGKLALALAYAQYLNCENRTATDSCGTCSSCVKSEKLAHPDVFYTYPTVSKGNSPSLSRDFISEWRTQMTTTPYISYENWIAVLDSGNKQGNITANECEQIVRQHSLRHFEGKYKIQIIWGAEFLNKEGNKLLKIIEEPPENTIFILIADSLKSILPTILSRTQIVQIPKINAPTLADALVSQFEMNVDLAQKLALVSDGSWLNACLAAEDEGNDYFPLTKQWLSLLIRMSRKSSLKTMQEMQDWINVVGGTGRRSQKMLVNYTLFFLRECLAVQSGLPSQLANEEKKVAESVADLINWDSMSEMSQLINNLHYQVLRNANAKMAFMAASVKMKKLLQKQGQLA